MPPPGQEPWIDRKTPEPVELPSVPQINFDGLSVVAIEIVLVGVTIGNLAVWGIDPLNNLVRNSFALGSRITRTVQGAFGDLGFTPTTSDTIHGCPVTSGYGERTHPVTGKRAMHPAIDIACPEGTRVYVPAIAPNILSTKSAEQHGETVLVQCRPESETGGGGLVGEVLIPGRGVLYQFLHLSSCDASGKKGGNEFARTGNTGVSTGAHLDFRVAEVEAQSFGKVARPLDYREPTMYEAMWALGGLPPKVKEPKKDE